MRKSLIAGASVAAMIALAATGCSHGSAASGSGPSKGSTLTVLSYPDNPPLHDWLKRCSAASGYKFKLLVVPQAQLITKAVQLTSSKQPPAIIIADNPNVAPLANSGALQPMSLGKLKSSDFVQGPLQAGKYKGKQYGIPIGNNGEVIVYNKKLLASEHIAVPRSWAQLNAAAKKLTKSGRYGFAQSFAAGETLSWNYWTQLWSNGGSIKHLDSPQAVQAAQFWGSFIKDGTAPRASLQWASPNISKQLTSGRLAMGQVGTWQLPELLSDAKKAHLDVGITPQVSPTGKPPIIPFGGEEITLGLGATGEAQKASNDCAISWSTNVSRLARWDEQLGYVPSYLPAQPAVLKADPYLKVLATMLQTSRSRTAEVGPNYPAYSTAVGSALQKIATGTPAQQAMSQAATAASQH